MEPKKLLATPDLPVQIKKLLRRFEKWRRTRQHREPIPESLWAHAVEVARRHGVARVSRQAHLDYYSLKERLDASTQKGIDGSGKGPAFVELPPLVSGAVMDCTVEFEHPRGARIRMHLKGAAAPDLIALAGSLWSAAS